MAYMNNPYMNMYPQNNGYFPQYQQQLNQNYNNQGNFSSSNYLNGQIVGDIESVKSKDVMLDGSSAYYPLSSGEIIYCKKLNPMTGASQILTYSLIDTSSCGKKDDLSSVITQIKDDIQELKDLVLDNVTKPKGGDVNE